MAFDLFSLMICQKCYLGVVLCVLTMHFDNLKCTVSEIFADIVETGSIDHTKAGPKYFRIGAS